MAVVFADKRVLIAATTGNCVFTSLVLDDVSLPSVSLERGSNGEFLYSSGVKKTYACLLDEEERTGICELALKIVQAGDII